MFRDLDRIRAAMNPARWVAFGFVVLLVIIAAIGPWLVPTSPTAQDIVGRLQPPGSPGHPLGTDELGRDVLARIVHGARVELLVAAGATALAAVLGTVLGLIGGFFRGFWEVITMRLVGDVLLAFPPIVLALMVVTLYGPGQWTLVLVMGVLFMPTFARIVYGQTLSECRADYVTAAEAFGARTVVRMFSVILPNVRAPIVVQCSTVMASAILLESGLSYLGLGIVPPAPSWGGMVASGQRFMSMQPWTIMVPSLTVVLAILAFGLLADGLRDWLDPRQSTRTRARSNGSPLRSDRDGAPTGSEQLLTGRAS
jgi:peptide/nickel transport system permease protein